MCGFYDVWVCLSVGFVMCGCVYVGFMTCVCVCVCVCVGGGRFVMCGCFGNMSTCIDCVSYSLYCVFCIVSFMYIDSN